MDELRDATEARTAATAMADERWRRAILAAVRAGKPRTVIADTAGISRGRLYQILGEQS